MIINFISMGRSKEGHVLETKRQLLANGDDISETLNILKWSLTLAILVCVSNSSRNLNETIEYTRFVSSDWRIWCSEDNSVMSVRQEYEAWVSVQEH
jgi:hypothetical protein